mmetsp:Transcript_5129/g.7842  ORF Transcript_5129/g.7842 Transcript_5129/m.7842 type:complete len:91 (+) Transcript_5129:558-830(+)
MTKVARERFIESLKSKANQRLEEFNALKGGSAKVMEQLDSNKEHFRYDVFKRQMFEGEYTGISRIVRERMNDPEYFNKKLRQMADHIRIK